MSRSRNLVTAVAALLLAVPSLQAVDLQSVAGSDTKLRVYGFVHIVGSYFIDQNQNNGSRLASSSLGMEGGGYNNTNDQHTAPDKNFLINYAPTRLGFASTTATSSLGDISTKIEMDFNGTNYPHTRLAQIDIGNWTIGQAWSTWVDGDAGADTVDWAGPVGSPCWDTPRFPLVRYTAKIDKSNTLAVSLEQNDGHGDGTNVVANAPATATGKADGKIPTFVAAYTFSADWGHVGLRALGQNYGSFIPATATTASQRYSKIAGAFMLSGDVKFGKDDLVYNVYTGDALGNYGVGFQATVQNDTTQTVYTYKNVGWMAGYTHNWTDAVRSNLVLSGVSFSDNSDIAATNSTTGSAMKSAITGNINTIVKLAKNCELGMEYIYEGAKAFGTSAGSGWVDKNDKPVNKNNSSKIEVTLHVGF
jgi:hypothetical protein